MGARDESPPVHTHNMPRHVVALVLLALLLGCGSVQKVRAYPSGSAPTGHPAVLRNNAEFGSYVEVERIDGIPVGDQGTGVKYQEIEVLPGLHTVEVSYRGHGISTSNARVTFDAKEGGQYEVQAMRIKEGFWSEFLLHAGGGSSRWTAWVVDVRTDAVVGGVRPKDSTFKTDVGEGTPAADSSKIVPAQP